MADLGLEHRTGRSWTDVIDGGCSLFYGSTADPAHRLMRAVGRLVGTVPRTV